MSDNKSNTRPQHAPRGYEWLPEAFEKEVNSHEPNAREVTRQALAEGDIKAILRDRFGQRYKIAERMWDKEPLEEKVYPRFQDGRMRMRLELYEGPYVEGWIFVQTGELKRCIQEIESLKSATQRRGPKRELTRLRWLPIHERGVRLHEELCPPNPVDEVYHHLLAEIRNSNSNLSRALAGVDGTPIKKAAIERGLRRYYGNKWYESENSGGL